MPVFAAVGAFFVFTRLAGTLQKHVFEPLVAKDIREAFRKARPAAGRRERRIMDGITGSWDLASGWAYDDPVELLADLAALGVKVNLIRLGVALPPRLGLALGTRAAVSSVETFLSGIQALFKAGVDPEAAAGDIAKGLTGFVDTLVPVDDELIESGIEVALDIAAMAGETGAFVSKASSGDVFGSLVSGGKLVKQSLDLLGSFLGFVGLVQEALPEAPPVPIREPRTLAQFEESLRLPPPPTTTISGPSGPIIDVDSDLLAVKLILRQQVSQRLQDPSNLRVAHLQFGDNLAMALKDSENAMLLQKLINFFGMGSGRAKGFMGAGGEAGPPPVGGKPWLE